MCCVLEQDTLSRFFSRFNYLVNKGHQPKIHHIVFTSSSEVPVDICRCSPQYSSSDICLRSSQNSFSDICQPCNQNAFSDVCVGSLKLVYSKCYSISYNTTKCFWVWSVASKHCLRSFLFLCSYAKSHCLLFYKLTYNILF